MDEFGNGGVSDMMLVAKPLAAENLVGTQGVEHSAVLAWSRSGRWRHQGGIHDRGGQGLSLLW